VTALDLQGYAGTSRLSPRPPRTARLNGQAKACPRPTELPLLFRNALPYLPSKHMFWRVADEAYVLGAAGEVTGSMHLVESGGGVFCSIADCTRAGGKRPTQESQPSVPGSSIDAWFSQRHIDHSGTSHPGQERLLRSRLLHSATIDLCHWMLRDTALSMKGCRFLNKRLAHRKSMARRRRVVPLYTRGCRAHPAALQPVRTTPARTGPRADYRATRRHILGSSFVVLHEASGGSSVRWLSGDIGRRTCHHPDPESMPPRIPDHGEHLRRRFHKNVSSRQQAAES